MDPGTVLGHRFPESTFEYSDRDAALYALGVGAGTETRALEQGQEREGGSAGEELSLVAPRILSEEFKVLPTFAVIYPSSIMDQIISLPSLKFDPALLLHGEHYIELFTPALPPQAKVRSAACIASLQDKGKSALIEVETESREDSTGQPLAINSAVCVLRGAGGFSKGQRATQRPSLRSTWRREEPLPLAGSPPPSPPTHSVAQQVPPTQALLYRLSGDFNPLHADGPFAQAAGFPQPILHGLCTLGYATRAVLACANKANGVSSEWCLRRLRCRFLSHVFPGETLFTQVWEERGVRDGVMRASVITSIQRDGKRTKVLAVTCELAHADNEICWGVRPRSAL